MAGKNGFSVGCSRDDQYYPVVYGIPSAQGIWKSDIRGFRKKDIHTGNGEKDDSAADCGNGTRTCF